MSPRDELKDLLGNLSDDQKSLVRHFATDLVSGSTASRSDLFSVVRELDEDQVARLLDVARAMALPIEETILFESDTVTLEFNAEFRSRLQAHHATHTTPMDRLGFENAFLAASRAASRSTIEAPSRTTRFFDATINGQQTALKTEGAASMKAHQLHISKLSEAAWIQDMRSSRKRHEMTMRFLDEFLAAVKRIYVLRYYRSESAPHYELVEIPVGHFRLLKLVPLSEFSSDAPRITVADQQGPIMVFHLDRSDSKITVAKIEKSRCVVHGDWKLTGMADHDDS